MRRVDVVSSIALGAFLAIAVVIGPPLVAASISRFVVAPALMFWYAGVALTAAAVVPQLRARFPLAVRVLGMIGVAWVTIVLSVIGLLLLIYASQGPIGP